MTYVTTDVQYVTSAVEVGTRPVTVSTGEVRMDICLGTFAMTEMA